MHTKKFIGLRSGISGVCEKTGVEWIDFTLKPAEKRLRKGKIKIASIINKVDLIISLPKFKNHDLLYFTGAIKNTLGLVPGFTKAKQHALHQNRNSFGEFLVDLNEAVTPDYFMIDGIMGMQGSGPANGNPFETGIIGGSANPLALDIIASGIAGYDPMLIPTSRIAFFRKTWLKSADDIIYDGPDLESLKKSDFRKIPTRGNSNVAVEFVMRRLKPLRKLERRPVFLHEYCSGCLNCIKICPLMAIEMHPAKNNYVILTDSKCIRCFCCSEVCQDHAIEIRRKLFGA